MKKVLSVILAIMMIASVVPMVFATEECEHVFNEETLRRPKDYFDKGWYECSECGEWVVVKAADYKELLYLTRDVGVLLENVYLPTEVDVTFFWVKIDEIVTDKAYVDGIKIETEQDEVDAITTELKKLKTEIENYLYEKNAVTVIDTTEYIKCQFSDIDLRYKYDEADLIVIEKISKEVKEAGWESNSNAIEYLSKAHENPASASQSEFDEIIEDLLIYINAVNNCIEGKHDYSKGTDNLDGTHSLCCNFCSFDEGIIEEHTWNKYVSNGDGTKTAKCTYCDATDTKVEEMLDGGEADIKYNVAEKLVQLIKMMFELMEKFIEAVFN